MDKSPMMTNSHHWAFTISAARHTTKRFIGPFFCCRDFYNPPTDLYCNHQRKKPHFSKKEGLKMKGFYTGDGYMGLVDGKYILFASESDYYEYLI